MNSTKQKNVSLYERLPEIYRIRDQEQTPPGQLKQYLGLVEDAFSEIHNNIQDLYRNLFIETCDDWVIPYIGQLLGVSILEGDPAQLRADVAEAIALRRRKGTLAGIERLTYNLTRWGVHCVELRENLVWSQHVNHLRPDDRRLPLRGGTMPLRDPAYIGLLNTPFDPFAHFADLKPAAIGQIRYNLPNLAVFLWRLRDYRVPATKPVFHDIIKIDGIHCACFYIHPLAYPVRLFNTYRFDPDREPPVVSELDETPNPIPMERLNDHYTFGVPEKYIAVDTYDPAHYNTLDIADQGLQFHLPVSVFKSTGWGFRGAHLCHWEQHLPFTIDKPTIVVDPELGRVLIAVKGADDAESLSLANALKDHMLVTYTYGSPGPIGAHPVDRASYPRKLYNEPVNYIDINWHTDTDPTKNGLQKALENIQLRTQPLVIEIHDSMVHQLDVGAAGLQLNRSLIIRAADGQRPIIKLQNPLRFHPVDIADAHRLTVRLHGLYLTGDSAQPLITRAAVNRLEITGCTLDPTGAADSVQLEQDYGFTNAGDIAAFDQVPEIIIKRSVTGPLRIDTPYTLRLEDSIIDAEGDIAVSGTGDPAKTWGPPTWFSGITVFGSMRVETIAGEGGIFHHNLEAWNTQKGCIKFSYFGGTDNKLPPNHRCVSRVYLRFVSRRFGEPGYGQLHYTTHSSIREHGPEDHEMGAYGFLKEAQKWRNLEIRYREFLPVGVRPILIPVT